MDLDTDFVPYTSHFWNNLLTLLFKFTRNTKIYGDRRDDSHYTTKFYT